MKDTFKEDVLFYDEEHGIGFISPDPTSYYFNGQSKIYTDYGISFPVFYIEGRFIINRGDGPGNRKYPSRESICERLLEIGLVFTPEEPVLLFSDTIVPDEKTKMLLILKGIMSNDR